METNRTEFIASEIDSKIEQAKDRIFEIFRNNGYGEDVEKLNHELNNIADRDKIRIAFIGQYSAGKSTIISALTSRRDIKIDSDIATTETTDYPWNSVLLADTPGLYTENTEHDEKAIRKIMESDLLVYVITSDLFNKYTKEDFKKWAFEKQYKDKMFLVINKMSKEAGEYKDLIDNYTETINQTLSPNSLHELHYSFVDAKDYKDGIDERDEELIEYSHFHDFIIQLNTFIKNKGQLGKMDVPIQILKSAIDSMSEKLTDNEKDNAYEVLSRRIENRLSQERAHISAEAHKIVRREMKDLYDKESDISLKIGSEKLTKEDTDISCCVENCCNNINTSLIELAEKKSEELSRDMKDLFSSKPAQVFFKAVEAEKLEEKHWFESKDRKVSRVQFENVKDLAGKFGNKVVKLAVKEGVEQEGFFIAANEAAGGNLHLAIKEIGQMIGVKFKPWQAVHIAKNVGNFAIILGPLVEAVGFAGQIKEVIDEEAEAKKITAAKNDCHKYFQSIIEDLESQYEKQIDLMCNVYSDYINQMHASQAKIEEMKSSNSKMIVELGEIKKVLNSIQEPLYQ